MKTKNIFLMLVAIAVILSCRDGEKKSGEHEGHATPSEKKLYTCPMHPQIISDQPGKCPICGMDLEERITGGKADDNKELERLLKPTNQFVVSEVKIILPEERKVPVKFDLSGTITYDTRQVNTVSARVSGRIERLYVKYRFQEITKGQKLLDLYSEDLVTEQQNYLFILHNDSDNQDLLRASEQKLLFLGLTQGQIDQIKATGKTMYTVTIYSSYSGHLHEPASGTDNQTKTNNKMESTQIFQQELNIKEGMYVSPGQTIFNIYGTEKVWALLKIPPDKQNAVKLLQKVSLSINGADEEISARIDFIEPLISTDQKYLSARVYLDNPGGKIKIGSLVKTSIEESELESLFIPSSAVVNLGVQNIVFVKQDGMLKTQVVQVGARMVNWTEIVSGLSKNDSIASNAQMLIDSESFIKTEY